MSSGVTKSKALKMAMFLAIISAVIAFVKARQQEKKQLAEAVNSLEEQPSDRQPAGEQKIVFSDDPYQQCEANVQPSFVNVSMTWGEDTSTGVWSAFRVLSPPSVIVTASGNSYDKPLSEQQVKASKDFDAIVVGSLSPIGKKSGFSQEGEEVHIMAPSDHFITSVDSDGNYKRFGGTSGAAPLVTGGLAGFEWLSGYHPTAKESKILLEKTAIPTPYSHDQPRKNGVGMLNAYKLGMVGKKLKQLCGKDVSCFRKMIQDSSTYNFPKDLGLIETVEQAFPECSQTCGGSTEFCADKSEVFQRLRKASFLDPSNKKLWPYLACIYESGGLKLDALAMVNTYKALYGPPKNERAAHTTCQNHSDCVLIPCSPVPSLPFLAVTKAEAAIQYAIGRCKKTLCNGKCRCGNEETAINQNSKTYSSRCVNSQCVLSLADQVIPTPTSQRKELPISPSDSGQR